MELATLRNNLIQPPCASHKQITCAIQLLIDSYYYDILEGVFSHNCITESDYTDTNSNIVTAESKWCKIQESNGT